MIFSVPRRTNTSIIFSLLRRVIYFYIDVIIENIFIDCNWLYNRWNCLKARDKKRHTSINCLMNLLHLLMLQMLFPKDQIDILSQHSMQISTEVHKVTYTIENSIQWQVISKWMQFYFFVRDKDRSCLRTRKTAKLNNGFSHWKQSLINFATLRTILSIFLTRLICCLST